MTEVEDEVQVTLVEEEEVEETLEVVGVETLEEAILEGEAEVEVTSVVAEAEVCLLSLIWF